MKNRQEKMKKQFLVSYSCGKDSTLALYRMIQAGHEPKGLLITINEENQRSWFHGVHKDIIEAVSKSLGIPVYFISSKGSENYLDTYETAMKKAVQETGATVCVFGDIDIEDHLRWCTARTDSVGVEAHFPLWQEPREKLVYETIDAGFKAIVKVVDTKRLSEKVLGKTLTRDIVAQIKAEGADACGENGEYHTLVYDGPLFKEPIKLIIKDVVEYESYRILDMDLEK